MSRLALTVALGLAATAFADTSHAQTAWGQPNPTNAPAGRHSHILVYDPTRQRTLLFGGKCCVGTAFGDTWEWDGVDWTQLNPAMSPSPRWAAGACFDEVRGRIILLGGSDGSTFYGDTWEWTGANWQIMFSTGPSRRELPGLAFDPTSRRPVLFGGGNGPTLGDMWQLTPTGWQQLTPAALPPATWAALFCADPVRNIAPRDNTLPWIGEDWVIDVTRLPPLSVNSPFGVIGMSNTSWLGVPLPLDLGFVGAPGCPLLTSADLALVPLTNTSGRATWAIPLPLDLRTLGVPFYIQAAVLDFGVNPLNLIVSNGGRAISGMK